MKRSRIMGIYMIRNKSNGKVYIGQSTDVNFRWKGHKKGLQEGCHINIHLQNAWNKYGEENFEFMIIEECDEDKLTEREQYWIDYYGGLNSSKNYNKRDAGNKGRLSEISKKKLSDYNKGKPAWNKGLTVATDERVAREVSQLVGRQLPIEMRKRISETVQLLHDNGYYDYDEMNKKRLRTMEENKKKGKVRKIRKDKGIKKEPSIGRHISEGKLIANERKRQLGLPLRNQEKKPIPMKTSICTVCGKEFLQRRCHYKKTCSIECMRVQISIKNKEAKNGAKK